jgi:hypothetical protein
VSSDPENDETYDLATDSAPRAPHSPPRASGPHPASAAPRSLSYRSAPVAQLPTTTPADPETLKNLHIPLALLAVGVLIEVIASLFREAAPADALTHVGIDLVGTTIFMLVGIFLAAKLRALDLGKFWLAVLKLAAISVAPAAALDLVSPALCHIPFGFILGWLGEFALYFAFLGLLFDLDESDTWFCVWIIFLVRLAFYFAFAALDTNFGP